MTSKAKNSTGLTGVTIRRGKYEAGITINSRSMYLGTFNTAEEAHGAYLEAKRKYVNAAIKIQPLSTEGISKKKEAKEYTRKMLESIDLKRVPERLKPLYAVYIANLRSGEYSAMTVRIGGKDAI